MGDLHVISMTAGKYANLILYKSFLVCTSALENIFIGRECDGLIPGVQISKIKLEQ